MRSMTGYGRAQLMENGREATVEVKTVNHRYLDMAIRAPRSTAFLEDALKRRVSETLTRGHADVFVQYRNTRSDAREVCLDEVLVQAYRQAADRIADVACCQDNLKSSDYILLPDVILVREAQDDQHAVRELLLRALDAALAQVVDMREAEGARMRDDLLFHLSNLEALRLSVAKQASGVTALHMEKMRQRIAELGVPLPDEQRLIAELALFADRCAIDEELARLESHDRAFRDLSDMLGEQGKKLDFLVQEMNREVNTIGSKASDAGITQLVVDMKSEIEKIREQVQNIE